MQTLLLIEEQQKAEYSVFDDVCFVSHAFPSEGRALLVLLFSIYVHMYIYIYIF